MGTPASHSIRDIFSHRVRCYLSLCKPRIVTLVVITGALGFFFGELGVQSWELFAWTLLGIGASCAGAAAINCYLERDVDALMRRTARRPLPSGAIAPVEALALGVLLVIGGTALLVVKANLLTGFLALLTAFLYALVYTPLKRVTWLNTAIGAIPGALPPMGGWAAATGELSFGAWVLFVILFFWQHPHFYSIAWMYRDDYAQAGFKMLPCVDPDGNSTMRQVVLFSLLLIPVSMVPTLIGMSGWIYCGGVFILGLGMLATALAFARSRTIADARRLLRASIIYLPLLLVLIVVDTGF